MPAAVSPDPAVTGLPRGGTVTRMEGRRDRWRTEPILRWPDGPTAGGVAGMRVKMILPALTEAKSPFFRPIKYSLFPPLGLATLAAYLDEGDAVTIHDEHVETLDLEDAPDLVVIQAYITSAPLVRDRRPLPAARVPRGDGRAARDIATRGGRRACRHRFPRTWRGGLATFRP